MKMTQKILIAIFFLFGNACNNPCQQICYNIRDFAEDCGEPFSDQDISECIQNQGKKTREEKQSCSVAGPQLEEEWTCDNLEVYFD